MEEPKAERFIRVTFITGHTNGVACFADNSSWWPKLFTAIKVAFEEKGETTQKFYGRQIYRGNYLPSNHPIYFKALKTIIWDNPTG